MSEKNTRRLLLFLFFLSGVSALIYQVVWVRMFGDVFGVTVYAVATVVTTFMAGLALGAYLFGKWVDRVRSPLRMFALLQLGIGLFALLFPSLLERLTQAYVALHRQFPTSFYMRSLVRFGLSFGLLILPTTLMGGTLPVLSKFFVGRLKRLGGDMGHLYAANNLGAVLGVFAAGFFLIRTVGMHFTINTAAAINLLVAAVAYVAAVKVGQPSPTPPAAAEEAGEQDEGSPERVAPAYPRHVRTLVLWAFGIEGFCALSYEVVWTRVLTGMSHHKTVYLFSTILISFIFGLSLGSFIVARFIDRTRSLLALFGIMEIAIGVSAIAMLPVFKLLPGLLRQTYMASYEAWWSGALENLIWFGILLVPTTLMGTTFPIVSKIYTRSLDALGRRIGTIGCLDTIGSIFGSFVAGFVLVPFIGMARAVAVTAAINLVIGASLVAFDPLRSVRTKVAAGVAGVVLVVGALGFTPSELRFEHWLKERPFTHFAYYREGVSATVAVPELPNGERGLMIDGFTTAVGNYGDLRVHKMLGYLPWLLHEDPGSSLVIGFGMGVTADSLAQPGTDLVQCVELAPEVLEAGECFSDINGDVLRHPKFDAVIDDGRSFLLVTEQEFDIITSNAVHAKLSCSLYTKDFYELCRDRLKEGGLMCQWLPSNWMTEDEYKMLIKSFLEVFPHTSLWGVNDAHTLLLGTPERVQVDFDRFSERLAARKAQQDLAPWDLGESMAFLAHYVADERLLTDYVSDVPANTDDTPYVEFSTEADMRPTLPAMESIVRMRRAADASIVDFGGAAGEAEKMARELERYFRSQNHALNAAIQVTYGDYDEAFREALAGRRVNPRHSRVRSILYNVLGHYVSRAEVLREEGRLREAVELLRKVLEADPGSPSALVELGLVYAQGGQLERAAETIGRAVEAAPNFAKAQRALGLVQMDQGAFQAAVPSLRRAAQLDPSDPRTHYYLAAALRQVGRLQEAGAALERTVQLAPRAVPPRMELAAVYRELGSHGKAAAQLRQVLRIQPDFRPAMEALEQLGGEVGG